MRRAIPERVLWGNAPSPNASRPGGVGGVGESGRVIKQRFGNGRVTDMSAGGWRSSLMSGGLEATKDPNGFRTGEKWVSLPCRPGSRGRRPTSDRPDAPEWEYH